MKILLSAYACDPNNGSEPGVGWNWVKQFARFHDVWVITRANNRTAISDALEKEPMPNVHWIYYDLPQWITRWKKGFYGIQIYYFLWQIGIYFVGQNLIQKIPFDAIQHITFGKYWTPSFIGLLSSKFIWGPVGGGESMPPIMGKTLSLRGKFYEIIRNSVRFLNHLNPVSRYIAKKSLLAIATTEQTAMQLKKLGANKVIIHPQCGITTKELNYFSTYASSPETPFRLISVGRLIHWKGFHLGLQAFADFQNDFPNSEYWLINDGVEAKHLSKLSVSLGIQNKVFFLGKLPTLDDVYRKISQSHVLVHPALHEAFGNVCLEAMAIGKPVICLDLGGPALQVTEDTGFKISVISPDQVIKDMAFAMSCLAENSELRQQMGDNAVKRANEYFNWDIKGQQMQKIYNDLGIRTK